MYSIISHLILSLHGEVGLCLSLGLQLLAFFFTLSVCSEFTFVLLVQFFLPSV